MSDKMETVLVKRAGREHAVPTEMPVDQWNKLKARKPGQYVEVPRTEAKPTTAKEVKRTAPAPEPDSVKPATGSTASSNSNTTAKA